MRAAGNLAVLERGHQEALENFLREFDAQPDELHGYFTPRHASIDQAIEFLRTATDESRLPPGRVPASTWFWENRSTLQGVVNLRHRLTPELEETGGHIGFSVAPSCRRQGIAGAMLAGALGQAHLFGLNQVGLTCDADNQGSARTIEAGGGILVREGWCEARQGRQRWYTIALPAEST